MGAEERPPPPAASDERHLMSPKDGDQPETEQTEASGPMLDMSQADVKKMVTKAKAKGYITYDE